MLGVCLQTDIISWLLRAFRARPATATTTITNAVELPSRQFSKALRSVGQMTFVAFLSTISEYSNAIAVSDMFH